MSAPRTFALALALGLVAGLGLGWRLFTPPPAPLDPPAPEVRQGDGSLVLERTPDPTATPRHEIPRGARVERNVSVTVRPDPIVRPAPGAPSVTPTSAGEIEPPPVVTMDTMQCPDITVDLSLVRLPDHTRRVVASARGGTIIGGLDIPVEPVPALPRARPWAIGGLYDPNARTVGAFLDRDLGPFRVGAELIQQRITGGAIANDRRWAVQVKAGWRF